MRIHALSSATAFMAVAALSACSEPNEPMNEAVNEDMNRQVASTTQLTEGATSFTEEQAREHLENSGFSNVGDLAKSDAGVWRGQAVRDGSAVNVAMDYKGSVATTPAGSAPPVVAQTADELDASATVGPAVMAVPDENLEASSSQPAQPEMDEEAIRRAGERG